MLPPPQPLTETCCPRSTRVAGFAAQEQPENSLCKILFSFCSFFIIWVFFLFLFLRLTHVCFSGKKKEDTWELFHFQNLISILGLVWLWQVHSLCSLFRRFRPCSAFREANECTTRYHLIRLTITKLAMKIFYCRVWFLDQVYCAFEGKRWGELDWLCFIYNVQNLVMNLIRPRYWNTITCASEGHLLR